MTSKPTPGRHRDHLGAVGSAGPDLACCRDARTVPHLLGEVLIVHAAPSTRSPVSPLLAFDAGVGGTRRDLAQRRLPTRRWSPGQRALDARGPSGWIRRARGLQRPIAASAADGVARLARVARSLSDDLLAAFSSTLKIPPSSPAIQAANSPRSTCSSPTIFSPELIALIPLGHRTHQRGLHVAGLDAGNDPAMPRMVSISAVASSIS